MLKATIDYSRWDDDETLVLEFSTDDSEYDTWAYTAEPGGYAEDDPYRVMQYVQEEILTPEWRKEYRIKMILIEECHYETA